MKVLARPGAAREPGGQRAAPWPDQDQKRREEAYDQVDRLFGLAIAFCAGAAFALILAILIA